MSVAALTLFAASQVGTPGPANMAILATSAGYGFRAALPFTAGVILGKQFIIWPMGFGLMELSQASPLVFEALKYVAAAYITYLAWRVANLRLDPNQSRGAAPGFAAGLIVHPMNPKAWAMITGAFTAFIPSATPPFEATLTVALVLLSCQIVLQPLWGIAGQAIATHFAGRPSEKYLMWGLAAATVLSVLYALFAGDLS